MIYFSLCQAVINRGIPGMPKIPIIKVDSGPSGYFDPCWINLPQKLILQPVQINKTAQPVYTLHALCSLYSDDLDCRRKWCTLHFRACDTQKFCLMLDPNQIHVKLINRSKLKSKNFNLRAVDWGDALLLTVEYVYIWMAQMQRNN